VLYQLAGYFYQIGLYREAISTAEILLNGSRTPIGKAPRTIAALAYPIAYYDLVLPGAQKYGVDPLLVFSVIRQESLFQSYAQSSALAQGLMQIIPDTGSYIAQKLAWADYQNSDLFRPFININFGIYYLKENLDRFKGSTYAALAAYNGGPASSDEWMRISGGDPDLFLQAIDYDETQTYVRKIYEQYNAYAAVYGIRSAP
jgi:soluble lytic murein transglycosylase